MIPPIIRMSLDTLDAILAMAHFSPELAPPVWDAHIPPRRCVEVASACLIRESKFVGSGVCVCDGDRQRLLSQGN